MEKSLIEQAYTQSLDDFAELLHRKKGRLESLQNDLSELNFKQYKYDLAEYQTLSHIAQYLVSMSDAIETEKGKEERDWLGLNAELEFWKQKSAHNWTLFKSAANSEHILLKSLLKQTEKALTV
jgi:hypothetical protein